jgi:hypothetical protein
MLTITLGGGAVQALLGSGLLDYFGHVIGVDFMAFYTGGRFFLEGRLAELYDLEVQRAFQVHTTWPHVLKGSHPFISPPFAIALFVPYAWCGYPVGLTLWWLTGLAALVASIAMVRTELGALQRYSVRTLSAASFLFFPTVSWFLYGQIAPLTLLLYTATFVLLRRKREFAAGFSLGLLAYKPQLAGVVALVLILRGRWWAVAGGAMATTLWIGIGFWMAPEAMIDYVRISPDILELLRWEGYPRWGLHSLMGFSSLLFEGISSSLSSWVALLLSVATLGFLLRHWTHSPWSPGSRSWDLSMAGTFALGLIISPHLFVYDLMLLLLPFAIVFQHYGGRGGVRLDQGPLLAWSAVLWLTVYLGSYLSLAQLTLTKSLGLPAMALQVSTVVAFLWARHLLQLARSPTRTHRGPAGLIRAPA